MEAAAEHTLRMPDLAALEAMTARFVPTDITVDVSTLSSSERQVLARLIEAARIVDAIFLRQVWAGNEALLLHLARQDSADGRARLRYFLINKGPWSRLDDDRPFLPSAPAKPRGANAYPEDASKEDVETWLASLTPADRERATGFHTAIRRDEGGCLVAVPYGVEYQNELARVASLLRDAARLSGEPTLRRFLTTRADAFLSNDYYESDVAWMEIQGAIEPTIGPYEVYEDALFNFKAGFEAYVTVRDAAESARLQRLAGELQDIEDHLPIDPRYRNPHVGTLTPIVVVNEVFAAGDGNHGVQTAAFNLPNDARIVSGKGTKSVMLKNVQEAKFAATLVPIAAVVLAPSDRLDVSFEAFFTHIVMHELMHGLGPHEIEVDGQRTSVGRALKEAYSFIEEAKADVSGLFALQHLMDKGVVPKTLEASLYTTFLASAFRSLRFGLNDAHGLGMAVQINYLLDYGGFIADANGSFRVDRARIREGVTQLSHDLMTLEAEGDYAKALELKGRLGAIRPEVQRALDRLTSIPVDLEPRFRTAEALEENPSAS